MQRHSSYSHLSRVTSGEEDAFQTAAPQTSNQGNLCGGFCLHVFAPQRALSGASALEHVVFCKMKSFFFFFFIQETYGDEECSWWVSTVRPSGGRCDPDKSGRLPVTYLTFPEVELRLIHHLLHLCASVLALYIFAPLLTAVVPRRLRKLLHNQL